MDMTIFKRIMSATDVSETVRPLLPEDERRRYRHSLADQFRMISQWDLNDDRVVGECWRFGLLQTLDYYTSAMRNGRREAAISLFSDEPPMTGNPVVDAGAAALADWLATRDGWDAPAWVHDPARTVAEAYPQIPWFDRETARAESPDAFRSRGLFVTLRSLSRA